MLVALPQGDRAFRDAGRRGCSHSTVVAARSDRATDTFGRRLKLFRNDEVTTVAAGMSSVALWPTGSAQLLRLLALGSDRPPPRSGMMTTTIAQNHQRFQSDWAACAPRVAAGTASTQTLLFRQNRGEPYSGVCLRRTGRKTVGGTDQVHLMGTLAELEELRRQRRDAFGRRPRAELLHVLMLPDFERAAAIGKLWGHRTQTRRAAGALGKPSYRVRRDSHPVATYRPSFTAGSGEPPSP